MKYLIENMLPETFPKELGLYIQTCAHIELASWHIVLESKGVSTDKLIVDPILVEYKLSTASLRKELGKAACSVPAHVGIQIMVLARDIKNGLINRNAAAHGAFFLDKDSGVLRVAHFFADGRKPNRNLYSIENPIPREMVEEALFEADRILLEAIRIREILANRRRTRLKPPPPSQRRASS